MIANTGDSEKMVTVELESGVDGAQIYVLSEDKDFEKTDSMSGNFKSFFFTFKIK